MKLKIGNTTKEISNSVHANISGDALDLTYLYGDVFGTYPVYRCDYTIHREDDDENNDIFQVIFDDLVKSGDFAPVRYEYEYFDKDEKDCFTNRYFLISTTEPVAISYEYSTMTVITHLGHKKVKEIVEKYLKKYNQDNGEAKCYIIVKDHDMYLKDFPISLKDDLNFDLYNEGFEDVHKDMVKSIKEDKNGLYLLYGAPGTGKTTYIRHLIKECETEKRKFVYVPSNLFGDFTNPSLIPFLMDHRGCIFIIEDCEGLVTVESGIRSAELTDLLNMTDGLLADALDIKIICTFNIDDGKIDDALLRPGRCKCKYEFDLLDKDRANKVAKKLGLNEVSEDTSLADLFNTGKTYTEKKKKMGFR